MPKPPDEIPATVDVNTPGMRLSISGTTVGVIVVVALLGMTIVAMKAIDMSDRTMDRLTFERETSP